LERGHRSLQRQGLLLGDVAVVQIEGFSAARLGVEVVLQFAPFSKECPTTAAVNRGVLFGVFWNIHADCPARFAVQFVVEALGTHVWFSPHARIQLPTVLTHDTLGKDAVTATFAMRMRRGCGNGFLKEWLAFTSTDSPSCS